MNNFLPYIINTYEYFVESCDDLMKNSFEVGKTDAANNLTLIN